MGLTAGTLFILTSLAAGWAAGAQSSAQWENEIQAFKASDRTNFPPRDAVLFVGSSSIRLWTNLAESFPDLKTIRRGFGGSCIPDSTAFAERIIVPYHPAKIVLYAGDNDVARGDSPKEVFENFRTFAQKIRSELPHARLYFIAIKPAPSRWHLSPQQREANRLVKAYCASHLGMRFIDVWPAMLNREGQPDPAIFKSDNLHMNAEGYRRWTKVIGAALEH